MLLLDLPSLIGSRSDVHNLFIRKIELLLSVSNVMKSRRNSGGWTCASVSNLPWELILVCRQLMALKYVFIWYRGLGCYSIWRCSSKITSTGSTSCFELVENTILLKMALPKLNLNTKLSLSYWRYTYNSVRRTPVLGQSIFIFWRRREHIVFNNRIFCLSDCSISNHATSRASSNLIG